MNPDTRRILNLDNALSTSGCAHGMPQTAIGPEKKIIVFFAAGNFASLAARKCVLKTTKNRANRVQWNFAADVDDERHTVRLSHKISDATRRRRPQKNR